MEDRLSTDELHIWHLWKRLGETVRSRITQEITEATGLSDPDYGILSRLDELGDGGKLRQQVLAESMHWSKSRLSHHLTRMEERNLIVRQPAKAENGIYVSLTPQGQEILNQARPVHAKAVRYHLLDRLSPDEVKMLETLATRLKVIE